MSKAKEKLIIIDGNALVHRSFHALPPTMKTKKGEVTNAIYGFASFLLKALAEFKPAYVILTLDKKGPTFRHKQYKEYKAKRIKAPDELYGQIPRVKEVVRAFGIPVFEKQGFEADDLIGTLTAKINKAIENIIVTGDMDTLQLINENTKVYTMSRGLAESIVYDSKKVQERFGLGPEQMIDYKALRGDPSDNIPGVAGIGEKSAGDLLKEFNALDKIYENVEQQTKKIREKFKPRVIELLAKQKKQAYMSKDLATIKRDVAIDFDLAKARFGDFDSEKIINIFKELEFNSLVPRLKNLKSKDSLATGQELSDKFERNKNNFNYKLIANENDFEEFFSKFKKQKNFTFDTETSGIDPLDSDLLGISFSWKKGEAYYLKIKNQKSKIKNKDLFNYQTHSTQGAAHNMHPWMDKLKVVFENKEIKKRAHNAKFDIRVLRACGLELEGLDFDTMIASYLLNPGSRQHNLDALTFSELGWEKISKDDLLGKGRDKITFSQIEDEKMMLYSCEDADFTNRLIKNLKTQLKEKKLDKLFKNIEMPLMEILSKMEDRGVKINTDFLAQSSLKMEKGIKSLEKKIWKFSDFQFNINSTKQLKEVLFEKLEIPTIGIKKGKTGYSTSADELNKLKDFHPIIPLIQEHRELRKLSTTYVDALPELVNKKTNRLHTSFNQTVTATGRLSSSNPNLQNIPVRTDLGREIRKAFVAPKGYKLLALDYSQIELRLAAHMSGDKKMIQAFKNGVDIHRATAAEINMIKPAEVTSQMRREAKAVNFGILYGQGPHGLSQTADISYASAKEFIEKYFKVYPGIKKYVEKTIKFTKDNGYVETLFSRRRYLPEIDSSVVMVRKAAERMAINMPLQGTSADMIKTAMIKINSFLEKEFLTEILVPAEIKMVLQVHDELIFEIKKEAIAKVAKKFKKIMEDVIKLKVPVIVDIKAGDNWGEMRIL